MMGGDEGAEVQTWHARISWLVMVSDPPNVTIPRRGSAMTSSFRFPRSVCYAALLMTVTGDLGTRDRLDAAFAREERRGLRVAGPPRPGPRAFIPGRGARAGPPPRPAPRLGPL